MELPEYDAIVRETLDALPEQLRTPLKDVIIAIEEESPPGSGMLLGLYEGVPLTAWGRGDMNGKPPDKISLFRLPIERVARTPEEIPSIVRETLWHEIAHYFGFGHDRIRHMEERWHTYRKPSSGAARISCSSVPAIPTAWGRWA